MKILFADTEDGYPKIIVTLELCGEKDGIIKKQLFRNDYAVYGFGKSIRVKQESGFKVILSTKIKKILLQESKKIYSRLLRMVELQVESGFLTIYSDIHEKPELFYFDDWWIE